MKAQMYNYSRWVNELNPEILKEKYSKKLTEAGFNILSVSERHFKPFGYTALFLLSESHLAIHTFPEEKTTYIELSSCVSVPFDNFINGQKTVKNE